MDPRVAKTMSHVKPEKLAETRQKVLEAVVNMADNVTLSASNTESSSRELLASPEPVLNRMFGYSESKDNSPVEKKCADEIVKYLDIAKALIVPKRPQDFDTLAWWSVNRAAYPSISKLARKWLGAVATSVPSERAFSTSGNIITAKRSSLAPELVRNLVFIADNLHRMKKIYASST